MMDAAAAFLKHIRINTLVFVIYLNEFDLHSALKCKHDVYIGTDGLTPVDRFMLYGVRAIPVPDVEELRIIGHCFRNVRNEDADLVDVWKFHAAQAANVRWLH